MRSPSLTWLLLFCGATAAAHEESFDAVWVQPLAPLVARGLIVPVGLTHGLASWADLTIEVTPYFAPMLSRAIPVPADASDPGVCSGGCRLGVYGLISTVGLSAERTFFSSGGWEFGAFLSPKVLAAIAAEPGTNPVIIPGASFEVGGGLDMGIEVHGPRPGFYAAIVIGWQVSRVFNAGIVWAGGSGSSYNLPPSWPVAMMTTSQIIMHAEPDVSAPNLNLVRVGWVF